MHINQLNRIDLPVRNRRGRGWTTYPGARERIPGCLNVNWCRKRTLTEISSWARASQWSSRDDFASASSNATSNAIFGAELAPTGYGECFQT